MGLLDLFDLFEQVVDVADPHVDAGEADVGDLVEAFESLGDPPPDVDRGDLALAQAEQAFFHRIHELDQVFGGDRPLVAGLL